MGNGDVWSVWIDYDGAVLSVAIADNSTARPPNLINYPIDIASILGGQKAYIGFTGATRNGVEYHRVTHWLFNGYPPFQGLRQRQQCWKTLQSRRSTR